jgi:PIN domain
MEPIARTGIPTSDTVRVLRELAVGARNVVAGGLDLPRVRDGYIRWVEDVEMQLRSRFASDDVWRSLLTDRFWRIRELEEASPRPFAVVYHEATSQADRLDALADLLDRGQQQFELPPGFVPVVADTNVFVHYRRYNEIDWPALAAATSVRLVVPLMVLDELDDLSYRARDVGDRARSVLRAMQELRGDASPEAPMEVRRGVTMQVLMDAPGHIRVGNNDQEILSRIDTVTALSGVRSVLVTGDHGMELRARSRSIRCVFMPDRYRLRAKEQEAPVEVVG